MIFEGKIETYLENKIKSAFDILGETIVKDVKDRIASNRSVLTGNLINSISRRIVDNALIIYTNVDYAPRVEFGFVGKDSLGRYYNQKEKSFLRSTLAENENKYITLMAKLMRRKYNG